MTWTFLFFANLTLLLRLRLLLLDTALERREWWIKCAIEIAMLAVIVRPNLGSMVAMAVSVAATVLTIRSDRRAKDRNAAHLLIGIGQLIALSFCFSATHAPAVRIELAWTIDSLRAASALGDAFVRLGTADGLRFLLGLLLVANEANLLIRFVLGRLQLKPGSAGTAIDASEYARGRVIGLLERMLIYFFVLNGQFGAVGFTLAAKGFTRFKELENRSFAEYVLIGTLLSSGLAMLIAFGVNLVR